MYREERLHGLQFSQSSHCGRNRRIAPTAAWLFAQAIQGKPIPNAFRAKAEARAKREQLEWLASISSKHEEQLRRLLNAEAEARHQRELLEWLATISEEHEWKLRTRLREEADAREAQRLWEQYTEDQFSQEAWDPSKHPRQGGPPNAGWWASAGGGGGSGSAGGWDRPGRASPSNDAGYDSVTPAMLKLAHAWWQTDNVLQQSRLDIER